MLSFLSSRRGTSKSTVSKDLRVTTPRAANRRRGGWFWECLCQRSGQSRDNMIGNLSIIIVEMRHDGKHDQLVMERHSNRGQRLVTCLDKEVSVNELVCVGSTLDFKR